MLVQVNGKQVELEEGTTIAALLALRGLDSNSVIVEHNRQLVKKEAWPELTLRENDHLEILRFVMGG